MLRVFGALAMALLALPALADYDAGQIADKLESHLTAHGAEVVHRETGHFRDNTLTLPALQGDLGAACAASQICLSSNGAVTDETMRNAMSMVVARDLEREMSELIEKLKHERDPHKAQETMIQIQRLMIKRNQAHEILTQMLDKHRRALDSIVTNMR